MGEGVVVRTQNTECTVLFNRYPIVGTNGLAESQQSTFLDGCSSLIGVIAGHHQSTGAALCERAVVITAGNLRADCFGASLIVLKTPRFSFLKRHILIGNAGEVIVVFLAVEIGGTVAGIGELVVFGIVGNNDFTIGCTVFRDRLQPRDIVGMTLIQRYLGDIIGPDVLAVEGVVEVAVKELSGTVHTLFKIRHAPAHTVRDFTFLRSRTVNIVPAGHIGAVGILVVGGGEQHFTNLNGRHIGVAGGEYGKSAAHKGCSH